MLALIHWRILDKNRYLTGKKKCCCGALSPLDIDDPKPEDKEVFIISYSQSTVTSRDAYWVDLQKSGRSQEIGENGLYYPVNVSSTLKDMIFTFAKWWKHSLRWLILSWKLDLLQTNDDWSIDYHDIPRSEQRCLTFIVHFSSILTDKKNLKKYGVICCVL
jgi:hypothetical protein